VISFRGHYAMSLLPKVISFLGHYAMSLLPNADSACTADLGRIGANGAYHPDRQYHRHHATLPYPMITNTFFLT
jgi:hypothetical protein